MKEGGNSSQHVNADVSSPKRGGKNMRSVQGNLYGWNIWDIKDKELLNLLEGRKGGFTTLQILEIIMTGPHNKHQISKILGVDYNTITYHIKLLHKHNYITQTKLENCSYYHPSEKIFNSIEDFNMIKEKKYKDNK